MAIRHTGTGWTVSTDLESTECCFGRALRDGSVHLVQHQTVVSVGVTARLSKFGYSRGVLCHRLPPRRDPAPGRECRLAHSTGQAQIGTDDGAVVALQRWQ